MTRAKELRRTDKDDIYSRFSTAGESRSPFWKEISDARAAFHHGGEGPFPSVRDHIFRSWKRSLCAHASRTGLPSVRLANDDLQRILTRNEALLSTASPIMEELLANIHPTNNCIILTDADGVYLHTLGDGIGFGRGASSPLRGLVSGESIDGTTSMSICLVEQEPTCVLGCEHYNPYFDGWSCAAAPIFDPENNLAGTLSMTMQRDSFNHHTFGLVIAAAKAVTEQMRLKHLLQETQTVMDILAEAVVVLDANGRVRVMNRYAKRLLHVSGEVLGLDFAEVAEVLADGTGNGWGEKEGRPVRDDECSLRLANGITLQCMYSSSPVPGGGLCLTLREAKRVHKLTNRMTRAKAMYSFSDILGESQSLKHSLALARKASGNSMTTLILGESGVGKELFAQAIHNSSDRSNQPFIVINCGAIPRDLVQSELFGYESGAFTGAAKQGAPGKFELANGGTLFLDEIGDMPQTAQVNLLRVLQEGEVTRVGGKRSRRVDVRVIAATHRDLSEAVHNGTFRHDLYYRLNVLVVRVPALRERQGDVRVLSEYFLNKIALALNKPLAGFSPEAMRCLENYDWPGNVRELENLIERTAVMTNGSTIHKRDLSQELWTSHPASAPSTPDWPLSQHPQLDSARQEERLHLTEALTATRGNVKTAAESLGISRVTLYARIRRHALSLDSFRNAACSN